MMTMGCPGRMQAKHHLVPPLILSEVLWEACHIALGQPFEFLQQLLPLVHRVKTLDPKHNFNLHFQGQHSAKRLVFWIHQPSAVHDDSVKRKSDLSAALRLINPHPGPIPSSRQALGP